ncbi:carbonic anhydrase [Cytophaga hutchinsonii]|uniref:Carbonic anhydrase n=1 Tax=Cytophaga hutchinsonii (strain ATCC 33406 / DSM 1761 / CIP 103989 / NBRC 15051 / NCIMB 9469 / D465) TaxID=269798 RepID=A0A6N4SPR6_CYTH3|nr:carbonic anhydrase [Cytophaga hutchinsonii]ABG58318.1 probable carbonate dehydratase (carbonic anhydrase) [Cytophaga hutchinsonii ATCC 33406]SFX52650.1 carbonic anhydrase [Cytophaga hutchinsonii ATCC 33406]
MKESYQKLLNNNKIWALGKIQDDADYFKRMKLAQTPEYLWIGCSDSRVPETEVTGTLQGQLFVHRNIANMVVHTDLNLLSVVEYAVEVLKVKHIIVCGHYGCGGVAAATKNNSFGYVDNWLRNIKEIYNKNTVELLAIENEEERINRLVELNVVEQVRNLAKTKPVQRAWKNRALEIHGWVYGLDTGIIKDLHSLYDEAEDLEPIFRYTFED